MLVLLTRALGTGLSSSSYLPPLLSLGTDLLQVGFRIPYRLIVGMTRVKYTMDIGAITQHASHLESTETESKIFSGMHDIIQLVAYEAGFVALSLRKGLDWGDERYSAILGREATTS